MSRVPTVKIDTKAGAVRINRSEYDPATHTLADKQDDDFLPFADTAAPPPPPAATTEPVTTPVTTPPAPPTPPVTTTAPPPPATTDTKPVEAFVTKNGNKWALADKDGKSVDNVDYDTKTAAEAALTEYDKK